MNPQKTRLGQVGNTSFTYDNEGQLDTKTGSDFTFDDAHRLTNITGAVTYQYLYDGAGNRLEATRNGSVTRYIYDANGNLLAEADGNNVIQKYYIYGAGLLAMVTPAGELYCYHFDATGHTMALTDAGANVVNKYAYTPFGVMGNQVEAVPQPFKYVGKYGVMTEPNGLYYMRARFYDANVGRFISEDPVGLDGGDVNLMAYVGNNPVNGIDPLGLWTVQIGLNGTGGGGAGGTAEAGIIFGYSKQNGSQFGTYQTIGGGGYGGANGSAGVAVSWSANTDIKALNGRAGTTGACAGEVISAGGSVSINEGARPSYSGNLGFGGGPTPVEVHGFITKTWVQDWTPKKH